MINYDLHTLDPIGIKFGKVSHVMACKGSRYPEIEFTLHNSAQVGRLLRRFNELSIKGSSAIFSLSGE